MSLFKDKYFPISFDNYLVHKENVTRYKRFISDNEIFNTFVYGPSGSGKYTLLINFLIKILGKEVINKKITTFNITKSCGNSKEYNIFQSNYHFEINLNKYLFNDRISLVNLINQLVQTKDINTYKYKIIIVRNIHYLNTEVIKYFASIGEKYNDNVRFLITCSNGFSRINKLMSGRYFTLRVSNPSIDELKYLCNYVLEDNNVKLDDKDIDKIVSKSERNLNKIYMLLNFVCIDPKKVNYQSPIELYSKEIYKIIKKKKNSSLTDLREYIYTLITKNICITSIIKELSKYILTLDIDYSKKQEVIKWASIYQYRLTKSYKEVIHLEAFVYKLVKILN